MTGGCLGVLFLIPLRRYFVADMHGKLPYPEATAITEVLVTGEKGGSQAKLLLQATFLAGIYDFLVTTFQVWKEYVDFQFVPAMRMLTERTKVVVSFDAIGFILGLGYVMGLRSSLILCAGGVLSNFVLVPLVWMIGREHTAAVYPAAIPIAKMTAAQIFRGYVRFVGVGAIATAGIFGIIKSIRIVASSFGVALRAFRVGEKSSGDRTDRDMPVVTILIGVAVSALAVGVMFGSLSHDPMVILMGVVLALVFSFFFTSVAANAIATTARNPVSGMTMLTIIISVDCAAALRPFGHHGDVLRDGAGGHGVHGAFGIRAGGDRFQDGLLAGLHAGRAAEGKVPGRDRCVGGGGAYHRDAGARVPVRRIGAGRPASGAALAAGIHHEGAGGRVHEPATGGVHSVRRRWGNRSDHGDARCAGADLRPGNVSAAGAEYAGAGGRVSGALCEQAQRESWAASAAPGFASAA